jgi:hypothetical protein
MSPKKIKEQEAEDAVARMAAECQHGGPVTKTEDGVWVSANSPFAGQVTVKDTLDPPA